MKLLYMNLVTTQIRSIWLGSTDFTRKYRVTPDVYSV